MSQRREIHLECEEICMFGISRNAVPEDSLLTTYRGGKHPQRWGAYADCFSTPIEREVGLASFVQAFYTTGLFKLERFILRMTIGAASTDEQARAIAGGSGDTFAAWYLGARTPTQLLICDRYESTRSWFAVKPLPGGGTLLQFGSAVAARRAAADEPPRLRPVVRALMGFHVLYSQALLAAARRRLLRQVGP
jgi:hypothetical protein